MLKLENRDGIALVTALLFTLISMLIVAAMYYLIFQGVKISGSQKRYHTALEASYAGAEIAVSDVVPHVFQGMSSADIHDEFSSEFNLQFSLRESLDNKLGNSTADWKSSTSKSLDPRDKPDITFVLKADSDWAAPYEVFTKIVDTIAGNTDQSGIGTGGMGLGGAAVTETRAGSASVPRIPYVYRMEILAQRANNPAEQARLTVIYAW